MFLYLVRVIARECRYRIAIVSILGVVGIALALVTPFQVGRLTNLMIQPERASWFEVQRSIALLVGAQVATAAISYWRRRTEISLQEASLRTLTLNMFQRILRFSADFFREERVESISSRALEDTNKVSDFLVEAITKVPLSMVCIIAFAAFMFVTNWFLALCMIPLSLLTGYFVLFDRRIQSGNQRTWQAIDAIRARAREVISGVSELRGHCAFDHGLGQLQRSLVPLREVRGEMARLNALFSAVNPLITAVQNGILYWVGAFLCIRTSGLAAAAGTMNWGEVIQFMLIAEMFRQPVQNLAGFLLQWRMTQESLRSVDAYLNRPRPFEHRAGDAGAWPVPADIAFADARVVAGSGASILSGIDLTIEAGRHVAVVGPAGSGKSTVIQLINREVELTSGRLNLGGRPVPEFDVLAMAQEVALVPQKPVLFDTSIRNNLLLSLRRPGSRTLVDEAGPVDVARFDHIRTREDLDRALLRVIELVGLQVDVFRKALDHPLPLGDSTARLRDKLGELRAEVAEQVGRLGDALVVPFGQGGWIPGTLGEWLFESRIRSKDEITRAAALIAEQLESSPILDTLLELGSWRLAADRSQSLGPMAPAPLLVAGTAPSPGGRGVLSGKAAGAQSTARQSPRSLPGPLRSLLLELALGLDMEAAREQVDPAAFEGVCREARSLIRTDDFLSESSWREIGTRSFIPGLDLRENLLCGRVNRRIFAAEERVDQVVRDVLDRRGLLPDTLLLGLEFPVGESGQLLSGGQRQKIALARALLKAPSILLLDEVTASLDEISQTQVIRSVLEQFAQGRTVLSVSHRLSTIRDFDRVVVLDRGRVVEAGTYEELIRQDGLFAELVHPGVKPAGSAAGAGAGVDGTTPMDEPKGGERVQPGDLLHRLARCPFFQNVRSEQLAVIEKMARIVECQAGTVLFHQGDPATELYVILEGEVEFFTEPSGDGAGPSEVVSSYGPGRAFGEIGIFMNGLRTLGARAKTDSMLCLLAREDLLDLIAADSQIAVALLQTLSQRIAELTEETYPGLGREV